MGADLAKFDLVQHREDALSIATSNSVSFVTSVESSRYHGGKDFFLASMTDEKGRTSSCEEKTSNTKKRIRYVDIVLESRRFASESSKDTHAGGQSNDLQSKRYGGAPATMITLW